MVDVTGSGAVEAITQLVQSIKDTDADGGDVVVGLATGAIEGLAVIANPVDALATSAIAWIIEQIPVLRWPLDITVGDPRVVESTVKTLNDTALSLHQLAIDQGTAVNTQVPTYTAGYTKSSIEFTNHMTWRSAQLEAASMACVGAAQGIAMGGTRIAAVRTMVRDLLAEYVWRLLRLAATRLPAGFLTAGAAVADFCARAMKWAADLVRKCAKLFEKVVTFLADIGRKLKQVADKIGDLLSPALKPVKQAADKATDFLSPVLSGTKWVPNPALAIRGTMSWTSEAAKVDTSEEAVTDPSGGADTQVKDLHAEEDTQQEQREERPPLGPTREQDWWTKRGNV